MHNIFGFLFSLEEQNQYATIAYFRLSKRKKKIFIREALRRTYMEYYRGTQHEQIFPAY